MVKAELIKLEGQLRGLSIKLHAPVGPYMGVAEKEALVVLVDACLTLVGHCISEDERKKR